MSPLISSWQRPILCDQTMFQISDLYLYIFKVVQTSQTFTMLDKGSIYPTQACDPIFLQSECQTTKTVWLKGKGVYIKGRRAITQWGVHHANSSKLSWRFQVYPKYHWNKDTYWYRLSMNYLMNIPKCITHKIERKFPLKPYLPEHLFCKYYSYRFKIWLFPIWSNTPLCC